MATDWDLFAAGSLHRQVDGTLVFVDISGFTNLSERLARRGRIGAEELTGVLNRVFGNMLEIVYQRGGSLLKFGGDALLLLFDSPDHVMQGTAATVEMRTALRDASRERTSVGRINLKMSSGIHTGAVDFFLVGGSHRELLVTGPTASITTEMESTADAGEILVSSDVKSRLPSGFVGDEKGGGWLLRKRKVDHPAIGVVERKRANETDLASFIPKRLRQPLQIGLADAEHRLATIGFVKFKGVDNKLRTEGPSATAEALHQMVATVQAAVDAEDVTFLASDIDADGGKIILAGGVPTSQHDDEGRLLRAGRRILDSELDLPLRIGINRGHVFSGNVGSTFRRTYTVMGDTVNLAARLMAAADAGSMYAAPSVLNLSSTLFRTEALEPFHVKGKDELVQAFSVWEETGVRPPEVASDLPFTGRDAELEMLVGIVNTCSRIGRGGIMTITGHTGIGKSRLISEILERCSGMDTLMIQAEPSGVDNPYWAFRDPLRTNLGIARSDQESMKRQLELAIAKQAPQLEPAIPLLGDVLHIQVDDNETTAEIEAQFRPHRTAEALVELLSSGHTRPVALIAEDGQWLDPASLALLAKIGEAAAERPWTILVTARDTEEFEPLGEVIHLAPLDDSAMRSIAMQMTSAAPLRPHDLSEIVEKAGGNPLFLGEILRVVAETGTADSLPDSLDAVVSREIDSLHPIARQLLRYASILGRRFRRATLEQLLASEDITADETALEELSGFIEADADGRLTFRHNVVHDVAYEGLSYGKRKELHGRAGDVIEAEAGSDPEAVAEYLAAHYSLSGNHTKAWRYAVVAGNKAKAAYANAEAVSHYRRALEAAKALNLAAPDRAPIYQTLGDSLDRLGAFDEARISYQRAQHLYEEPHQKADVIRIQAAMLKRMGRLSSALRTQTKGLAIAKSHDLTDISIDLLAERAAIRLYQGRYDEAVRLADRAISEAPAKETEAVALAEITKDWALTASSGSTEHDLTWSALETAEKLGDFHMQGVALNNLGMYAYYTGDWDQASELYERAAETLRRTGDDIAAAYGTANIAEIHAEQGHVAEAESGFRSSLPTFRAAGDTFMTMFVLIHLGRLEVHHRRLDQGLAHFAEAATLADQMGASTEGAEISLRRAEALATSGRAREARGLLEEGGISKPETAPAQLRPLAYRVYGSILIGDGLEDPGFECLRSALEASRALGSELEELQSIHLMAAYGEIDPDLSARSFELSSRLGVVAVRLLPIQTVVGAGVST